MTKAELRDQLRKKYSFEKSYAIAQIAIEDGYYDNKDVHVVASKTLDGIHSFQLYWKEA